MATLDQFIPLVRGSVPGAPNRLILDALRDAAIEFCARTKIEVEEPVQIVTSAGVNGYDIAATGGTISEIQSLWRDRYRLEPLSTQDFHEQYQQDGAPWKYTFMDQKVYLYPTPDAAYTLNAVAIIRPADDSNTVPDELYTNWRRGIAYGAKFIMHSQYDSYLDPGKAAFNKEMFDAEVFKAGMKRARGGTSSPPRVRSRFM